MMRTSEKDVNDEAVTNFALNSCHLVVESRVKWIEQRVRERESACTTTTTTTTTTTNEVSDIRDNWYLSFHHLLLYHIWPICILIVVVNCIY